MASGQQEISLAHRTQYIKDDDDSQNYEKEEEQEEQQNEEEESLHGWESMACSYADDSRRKGWQIRQVLDPRAKWFQEWNKVFLLVCAAGMFVDPLFFHALSISDTSMCLFVDGWFALTVTILRCMIDVLHVWNVWLQLKMSKKPYDAIGAGGKHHYNSYAKAKTGLLFDIFVILPLPQVVVWLVIPYLMERGSVVVMMTVFLIVFLLQYLPKIYHSVCLMRRMENLFGHIFGTVWWGIALTMIAYFVAAHAAGACWYSLGLQRAMKCLRAQCGETRGCDMRSLSCKQPVYYGTASKKLDKARWAWASNKQARSMCLGSSDNYDYASYEWTVQLVTNDNRLEKILLPFFWGLMTMGTFGNLVDSTEWSEDVFNIIVLMCGLLLVSMLMGNIKEFLVAITSKKQAMRLKMSNIEWWMKKRVLPEGLRLRVRNFERQNWAAMRGVDECGMIRTLPEGLRREIKDHLCLDLVRQVPLFQHMDELVLGNICDRMKPLVFTKGETITREGDPVRRMLFVVRGHLHNSQALRDGVRSYCMLGPGNFSGDELLSWCLRRPFIDRLPPSSSTVVTLETTEAFGLEAEDVKYVTQHFRYTFDNERVKRTATYYSPSWRTWAAVTIQLAWRSYKHRSKLTSLSFKMPRKPSTRTSWGDDKLRLYTALLTSPKPDQR